ncbi:MAG: transcriptional repressor LexA [Candidatus Sumerlaeota bacterium]
MAQYLTKRQREMLDFLERFIRENGYSPSLEEICEGVGLSSIATVHVHLRNLEAKKMIRRLANRSRSIELLPAARKSNALPGKKAFSGTVELPLLGRVAAGEPIEALVDDETVEVPGEFVRGRESFVLRVKGDSMIEDQIRDGDLVIVERRETANAGETVVALVGGSEATVKRFYHQGNNIRLQPANAAMQPIIVPADECEIQGVVIGLLRKY